MIERGLGMLVAAALLASAVPAGAAGNDVRRERTERRPYIVEVGEPYAISLQALQREAGKLNEVHEYLEDYGNPDYVEIQEIEPQWPWEDYEVRMFYLRRNLETDFGHVLFSAAMPDLGVVKFVGPIPMDKAHQIEVILQARQAPPPLAPVAQAEVQAVPAPAAATSDGWLSEALVARIEAAAERAEQAADRAVSQSEAATQAADRTDSIVNKLVQSAPRRSH